MRFDTDYYHALDRDYRGQATDEKPLAELSIKNIGVSAPPFSDQVQGLKSRIFQGASRVELGFTGAGKGSMQGQKTTPGMYSSEDREAIRDLAKINEVKLSTHASYGISPLSGLNMQQGEFSDQMREQTLHEIQRAIDFAADTAKGGAIVVHTGEFPRAIYDEYGHEGFKQFEDEHKKGPKYVVDDRTGRFVTSIRKEQIQYEPVYVTAKDRGLTGQVDKTGHVYKDDDWVDISDNYVDPVSPENLFNRVPKWDAKNQNFETRSVDWQEYKRRASEWNKMYPDKTYEPEEFWVRTMVENQVLQAKGHSLFYAMQYEDAKRTRDKAKETLAFYEKLEDNIPEEDKWKILQEKNYSTQQHRLIPPDIVNPSDLLKEDIKNAENRMRQIHEASSSADVNAKTQLDTLNHLTTIKEYGVEKAADTIARAAEFAYVKTKELESRGELRAPLFVAPENIEPDMYGGHPQELKQLVLKARASFVQKNKQRFGEEKATKLAAQHIKATFDVGHANIWRKYFDGDPKKSIEENDRMFKKWLVNQVKDLNEKGIIGHVHVSDNFGYADEHVTPGLGKAPIKEFIEELKKAGIKDVIVEPGHQDIKAMLGGWREFGGSVYGAHAPAGTGWTDIEHSYFGQTRKPYFMFGDYAPSQDFTLWTGVKME